MVFSANMNSETKEWTSKFENYRVLVGPKANIDNVNAKIKENLPADGALYTINE